MKEKNKLEHTYYENGFDLKKFILLYLRKSYLLLCGILLGMMLGGVIYQVYASLKEDKIQYVAENEYYITFNFDEFDRADDYYNAYTWGTILKTDPIIDKVVELSNNSIEKEVVLESVSAKMLSDYRILTIVVETADENLTNEISSYFREALPSFADKIDMLEMIEPWTNREAVIVYKYDKVKNASMLGGIIGLIFSFCGLWLYFILKDKIYVESDIEKEFGIFVITNQFEEKYITIEFGTILTGVEVESLRNGVTGMICVPFGTISKQEFRRYLTSIQVRDCKKCKLVARITDSPKWFAKWY